MTGFSFLAEESAILVYAGILGLEMGLVYDFLRVIRQVWRCGFVKTALMDLCFWSFVGYRTFEVMHTYSNGTLRWFAILGAMAVLVLYRKLFGKYLVRASVFLLKKCKMFLKTLTKFLKLSIIKVGKHSGKGEQHGKTSGISDKIP